MSRLLSWIKGTSDELLQKWLPPDKKVDEQRFYYGELLEDLNHTHLVSGSSSLAAKIETLKLEVRYILPYAAASGLVGVKTIPRHFRTEGCSEGLDELVDHMTERTLLVIPDATEFYQNASVAEYDWLKCADCVLDNFKYVQSLEAEQIAVVNEDVKGVEEGLRLLTTFRVLMGKWKFEGDSTSIYQQMNIVFREAAYIFRLFLQENMDPSGVRAMHLELSVLLQKVDDSQQQARVVYFEKINALGLSSSDIYPVNSRTLCCFIDTLQNDLKEILQSLHCSIDSKGHSQMQEIVLEMEFIRTILMDPGGESMEHGHLDAISTHIDVLIHEAESVICSSCEMLLDMSESIDKVKETRREIRKMNKTDVMLVHSSIVDLLTCFETLLSRSQRLWTELLFLLIFLRCTARWCIDYPLLETIRIHFENVVRNARWDLRRFLFRQPSIGNPDDELESLLSDFLKQIKIKNPAVKEVCTEIKDLKPSTPFSEISMMIGVDTADAILELQLEDEISFLGQLRAITAMLCINDESSNDLLTYLEDLNERAVCLSYLHIMEEPGVSNVFDLVIHSAICGPEDFEGETYQLMLAVLDFLILNLSEKMSTDAITVASMDCEAETLQRELIMLRCILCDPLLHYSEQAEQDDLLKDIGEGISEAGTLFCCWSSKKLEENTSYVVKAVDRLKAAARQAYVKFAKLSPSMFPETELGFWDMLLGNLMEVKKGNPDCATFTDEVTVLQYELEKCRSLLQGSGFKHSESKNFQDLKAQILIVAHKIENVIDTFAAVPDWYFKMRLSDVTEELKLATKESAETDLIHNVVVSESGGSAEEAYKQKHKHKVTEFSKDVATTPNSEDEPMIGFEDEEQELLKQLCRASQELEVVAIVGMPGLGKTTLAMKVYEGAAPSFHTHAWCFVSQNFQPSVLLRNIINQINGPNRGINDMNVEDLAQTLYQSLLKKRNYLIVLDDVWDIKAWNILKRCFPLGNNNGGKVLLTTRFASIGAEASGDGTCIELQPLPIEKSWRLLEQKVFGARRCPEPLEAVGRKIARKIGGMPFSIAVIAGVLKHVEEEVAKWKEVEQSLVSFVENQDDFSHKLDLSYSHLPLHLKQCFLYCGTFLRGNEISRKRLLQMWVAERFIDETDQLECLEDATECYLRDLVNRSLIMVSKTGSGDRIQSCRMNDLVRDFCTRKAEDEKFLHISHRHGSFPSWHRRVCFRRTMLFDYFEDSLSSTAHTRSLIFSPYVVDLEPFITVSHKSSFDFDKFKYLKLLDMEDNHMGDEFPESIAELTLLRYLAVKGDFDHIPSFIGELLNLETLIVAAESGTSVSVPTSVFDLQKLKHLRVDGSSELICDERSGSMDSLQTLSTPVLSNSETCEEVIARLPNLRKLKCIFGDCWDEDISCNVFPDLSILSHLETLRVMYSGELRYPCRLGFPSTLKKLTLTKFCLPWSEMETIAKLTQLEILKLKVEAFKGQKWVTEGEFPNLKYLRLEELDIEEWETSEDSFPSLERLVVQNCQQLKSLPSDLGDFECLNCIEVSQCAHSVAESAEEIETRQRNSGNKHFKIKASCIGVDSSYNELDSLIESKLDEFLFEDFMDLIFDLLGVAQDMGP